MRIAYLLLAHNTPNHLKRIISALSSPNSSFFIHIDKKSNISAYERVRGPDVYLLDERIPVYWGDFSVVEAEIMLLKKAFESGEVFDRYVLLTGADYPVRSKAYIEQFFEKNMGREFINMVEIPSEIRPVSRLTEFNFIPRGLRVPKKMRRALIKALNMIYKRDYHSGLRAMVPYAGSQTWAFTPAAVRYILDFCERNHGVVRFFKYTHVPDEAFFQTILGNSLFKSHICRALTYTEWEEGMASPNNITEASLIKILRNPEFSPENIYGAGEILFARKFPDNSSDLTGIIDRFAANSQQSQTLKTKL